MILFTGLAFFAEAIATATGFSASALFVPLAQLLEPFTLVLVLTAFLHTAGNLSRMVILRKSIPWRLALKLGLPSTLLCGLGALATGHSKIFYMQKILGLFLVAFALIEVFGKKVLKRIPPIVAYAGVGASGFLTGFIGTGGALRNAMLGIFVIEKTAFVALSSAIDIGGDVLRLGIYLSKDYMDWTHWYYVPLLLASAYLGSRIGGWALAFIPQKAFSRLLTVLVLLGGVGLLL